MEYGVNSQGEPTMELALVYGCINVGDRKFYSILVYARDPEVSDSNVNQMLSWADEVGLDTSGVRVVQNAPHLCAETPDIPGFLPGRCEETPGSS